MNIPCHPEAIVFDMDGLLVDSEIIWKEAETALLAARGATYDDDKHAPFIGMGMEEFLSNIRRVYEVDDNVPTLYDELIERFLALVDKNGLQPQPGAPELVAYVLENNIPRAIASSSPLVIIDKVVSSQPGWSDVYKIRCSGDEVTNGKPAPDVYLLAAERIGVNPTNCLALEDSPNGARAAVAAGMATIAVPDLSHTVVSAFDDVTPNVYDNLHSVLAYLKAC